MKKIKKIEFLTVVLCRFFSVYGVDENRKLLKFN